MISSVVPELLWSPKLAWTSTRSTAPFSKEGPCREPSLGTSRMKPRCPSVPVGMMPWPNSVKLPPSPVTRSSWWMHSDRFTSRRLDPHETNNWSCCTTKTIMMSSPNCRDFSGPVMCVRIVGNPMTMRDCIDVPKPSCAEPVDRKIAPTFNMRTPGTWKPLNVAGRVIGTFLDPRVWKPMPARPMRANPSRASRPPCALNDTDALTVINKMWACPAFNVTVVST